MELEYIKANGKYYYPQESGVDDPTKILDICHPVCFIKKLMFGRWKIELYDPYAEVHPKVWDTRDNQTPNVKIILYPSGIEEIRYTAR